MIEYDPPVYRPPGEWRSFLVQATIGCSHNGCTFCGMYKGKKFRIRPMDDIIGDIREAAAFYNQYEKVFLCDGDAIVMKTEDLLEIIGEIKKDFPHCRLISTYAGPRSTLSKTPEELKILHEAGLGRAYPGRKCWRRDCGSEMRASTCGALSSSALAASLCLWKMPGRLRSSSTKCSPTTSPP